MSLNYFISIFILVNDVIKMKIIFIQIFIYYFLLFGVCVGDFEKFHTMGNMYSYIIYNSINEKSVNSHNEHDECSIHDDSDVHDECDVHMILHSEQNHLFGEHI